MKFKKWKRLIIVTLSLVMLFQAAAVTALSASANEAAELHPLGCIRATPEELDKIPDFNVASTYSTTALPAKVDLTSKFPTPGDQGSQNSCTAWAVAYAAKTFQEQVRRNWGQNTASHKFSPAYIYNQTNSGRSNGIDGGAYTSAAINTIISQGVCSLADMPYNEKDFLTQPNAQQRAKAANYKSVQLNKISNGNIHKMKYVLNNKIAVILDIPVYPDFDGLNPSDSIYDDTTGEKRGDHAICLIGYDDDKKVFKFINSWGTKWGLNGYGYIAYDLLDGGMCDAYIMYEDYASNSVIYESNGGTGSMPRTDSPGGQAVSLRKNDFEKTGYHFTGWNVYRQSDKKWYCSRPGMTTSSWYAEEEKPIGAYKTLIPDQSNLPSGSYTYGESFTVYAQWEKNTYTVKYNPNGGNGTMADTSITWGIQTPLRDLAFTKAGATFTGWYAHRQSDKKWYYTNASGVKGWYTEGSQPSGYTKALYPDKAAVAKTSNVHEDIVTMYAQWRKHTFTVKYNPNGGTGSMEDTTITYGNLSDTLRPNTFVKEGYSFKGWYLKKGSQWYYTPGGWLEEGEESVDAQKTLFADIRAISTITSEDKAVITAYAQWEKITLCYGDVNGDGSINSNDIILIQNYISMVAALKPDQIKRADVNADGQVSSLDVIAIQKYIAKQEHNSLTGSPVV